MKLAVIADIHGNIQAIEAVLADLERQSVDSVIVNGDLVNRCPDSVAVLTRLAPLGLPWTIGNHDDLLCKWADRSSELPNDWFDDPFWLGTAWSSARLVDADQLAMLRHLPMTHCVATPNAPTLLISHGSPRHYREGYDKYLPDDAIAEIVQHHPADIFIGSHTHRPYERRWGRYLVLNSGAVGTPFNRDRRAQYLLLTLRGRVWQPEFRAVPYDVDTALERFETSGYLAEGGLSALIFYHELRLARPLYAPFWMWSEQEGLARTHETWRLFEVRHPERFAPPLR